jgi:membrane protein
MNEKLIEQLRKLGHLKFYMEWLSHYFGGIYERANSHHIFLLAGGLAFSLFVCIIPLTLIVFSVLGNILEKPDIVIQLDALIDRIVPYQETATFVKGIVFARVDEFAAYKNVAGLVGLVGLLFAASGLFSSMRTILNAIYKVKTTQSPIIGKLRDLGLVLMVLIYFLLSTTILPGAGIARGFADQVKFLGPLRFDLLEAAVFHSLSFLLICTSFLIIYFFVPQKRPRKRAIIVSAIAATVLWILAEKVFGFYITNFVTFKRVYGTYSFLLVMAFWIYYTSIAFIIGAEIGQLYQERVFDKPLRQPLEIE